MENKLIGRLKEQGVLLKALYSHRPEMVAVFKTITQTRKQVFLSLLTTFGLKHNEYSLGLIDKALTMDILFTEDE